MAVCCGCVGVAGDSVKAVSPAAMVTIALEFVWLVTFAVTAAATVVLNCGGVFGVFNVVGVGGGLSVVLVVSVLDCRLYWWCRSLCLWWIVDCVGGVDGVGGVGV